MTVLVSSPSNFLLGQPSSPNASGILLNSRSRSNPLHPPPKEQRDHSPSASSSSSNSFSHSPSPDGSARRIRFAPLPDPRRDKFQPVFDESDSDAQPTISHTPHDSCTNLPPSPRSIHSDLRNDEPPAKSKTKTWGQKFLRPLLNPRGVLSTDESSTSLFRISSRDSAKQSNDSPDEGGAPLRRRMSTGCPNISSTKEAERSQTYAWGAPLTPVMSEGSVSKGRKDGQRMLNGHVYGRRPSSADAAKKHGKTSPDPEFVEWGYGGMGSVTNDHPKANSGPDWARLGQGKFLGEAGDGDTDGDDGSGMGWVKRRREQREREKKEKEEREGAQQAVPEITIHPPEIKEKRDPAPDSTAINKETGEYHVYRAVSVPAPHHHIRHHSHHKTGDVSGTTTPTSVVSLSRANSAGSVPLTGTSSTGSHSDSLTPMPEHKEEADVSSGSSITSTTSSLDEEEDEVDDNDTERESDDEDDDDAGGRITSKGAGVEKISRHK